MVWVYVNSCVFLLLFFLIGFWCIWGNGSHDPGHYDLLHNVYVQVSGWKRFLLMDPCYAYDLYPYPQGHPMDRCSRADLEAPNFQSFPKLRKVRAIEAILGPGDVLILPCGWYHHVQSLTEDSMSVSFWFSQGAFPRVGTEISPLNSLQRLLLCREVEGILLLLKGVQGLSESYRTMRKLLLHGQSNGEDPLDSLDPQEVYSCSWILWRVNQATRLGRELLWALADTARFDGLKFHAKKGWAVLRREFELSPFGSFMFLGLRFCLAQHWHVGICWDGPFLCGNAQALVVCARNVWSDYASFLGGVKLDFEFHLKRT